MSYIVKDTVSEGSLLYITKVHGVGGWDWCEEQRCAERFITREGADRFLKSVLSSNRGLRVVKLTSTYSEVTRLRNIIKKIEEALESNE